MGMVNRKMHDEGLAIALFRCLRHPRYYGAVLHYMGIVTRDFFWNQWFPGKTPGVNVAHPLDVQIPYDNNYAPLYIDFIKNWIRMLNWAFRRRKKDFAPQATDFVRGLTKCYKEAGWIYNRMKSTTPRPRAGKNVLTRFIQSVDPHLHCIPSLHVVVVCYTYIRFCEFFPEESEERQYLYHQALMITESILYMKQHSLNCIGASLFFLHHLFPEYGDAQAEEFTKDLFELLETDLHIKADAREAILQKYYRLRKHEEEHPETDYKTIILEILAEYPPAKTAREAEKILA